MTAQDAKRAKRLVEFMTLANDCAGSMPPDGAPVARKLVKAYEALLHDLQAANAATEAIHYLWGNTLGRIESVKAALDVASTRLTYDCLRESTKEHTEAKP